ncbi:MAG TPA: DUF2332 domain-containing protein [Acidimicrobiales bacterium]
MSDPNDDFVQLWSWFATHCEATSPLYQGICSAVAEDQEILDFVRSAPPAAHLPTSLLASVHYLVLDGVDSPLVDIYAGRVDADPGPPFLELCRTHQSELMALLSSRHIQTNDCGRSALIGPGLTWLASRLQQPMSLIDVGASAGINLLCDNYLLDYGAHGTTGPIDSSIHVVCEVLSGSPPIATHLPTLVDRIGIDRSPIDLTNPSDAKWLLACVWPDSGRTERVAASIKVAQANPPRVIAGDGNDVLPQVLTALPDGCAAVVMTTWAVAYFSLEDRQRFMQILIDGSYQRPIAWLSAEGAATVEDFAAEATAGHEQSASDILGAVIFEEGERQPELLAYVQEHGNWMHWQSPQ